jgi:hypothetical protein
MTTTTDDIRLWVRAPGGRVWPLSAGKRLQEMAMRWNSVVRNRARWDTGVGSGDLEERARMDLAGIGCGDGVRQALCEAGMAEIGTAWTSEEHGWEARVMPWEFVIALATRDLRKGRLLTVWRHLDAGVPAKPLVETPPASLAFIDSTPGALKRQVSFQMDRQVIASALGLEPLVLTDPELPEVQARLAAERPEVVHLAVLDDTEAAALLKTTGHSGRHGLCFKRAERDEHGAYFDWIVAESLAGARARLVSFSAQYSARVAALAVAIGHATTAVGFQDDIDRDAARTFYAEFYRQWRAHGCRPHTALLQTRVSLRARGVVLNGAGLVLWSDRSLIDLPDPSIKATTPRPRRGTRDTAVEASPLSVEVECEALPRLNYSLLHNDRDLLKRFTLVKVGPQDGVVRGVGVRVALSVGGQDVAWRSRLTLDEVVTDLRSKVRVPVVANLGRLRESVRSTLLVEVDVDGRLVHQSTHPVQLLAGDEWTDDDQDRQWLPSFVLPRDPAVTRIVDQAQRALCTLADDPDVGFDGYQGLGSRVDDDPCTSVDLQAQALWAALTWDIGLAYVNPPPTYTAAAQRVRSPSAVLEERRGTCLDLALLLAACWERIGLRPVLLLLKGHALPGYWRSEAAWEAFRRGDYRDGAGAASTADHPVPVTAATAGWMVEQHDEVVALVRAQAFWPVEATRIAKRSGFFDAVQAGMDALRLAADFDCLIDLSLAREKGVLPLP